MAQRQREAEQEQAEKKRQELAQAKLGYRINRVWQTLRTLRDERQAEHAQHDYIARIEILAQAWPKNIEHLRGFSIELTADNRIDCATIAREQIIDDDTLFKTPDPWQLFELLHQAAQKKLGTTNTTHDRTEPASVEQGGLFSLTTGGTR